MRMRVPIALKRPRHTSSPSITQYSSTSPSGLLPEIEGDEISYLGSSMYPTFIDGDRLIFDRSVQVKRGDVIVYPEPLGSRYIIHRVIKIRGDQVQTAGDNNQTPDSYQLDKRSIIGKVNQRRRFDKSPVRGGILGIVYFWYMVKIRRRVRYLLILSKPVYDLLARNAVLGKIFAPFVKIQPVVLVKDGKTEVRLFLNNHYAGVRKGSDRPWSIRPPFRLLIDPDQLPDYGTIVREALEGELRNK